MSSNTSPSSKGNVAVLLELASNDVTVVVLTSVEPDFSVNVNWLMLKPRLFVKPTSIAPRLIVALLKKSVLAPTSMLTVGEAAPNSGVPGGIKLGFRPVNSSKLASPKAPLPDEKLPKDNSPTSALNSVPSALISGIASFRSPNSKLSVLLMVRNPASGPLCVTVNTESNSALVVSISTSISPPPPRNCNVLLVSSGASTFCEVLKLGCCGVSQAQTKRRLNPKTTLRRVIFIKVN